jgi:hypothetical protein
MNAGQRMKGRRGALIGSLVLALAAVPAGPALATCGEDCDSEYGSAIDDCKSKYGDDPTDADDLATCIQEAREDYRSCLDNCAADAGPLRRPAGVLARVRAMLAARRLPQPGIEP